MATPPFSMHEWRDDDLRDINFWLDGYRRTDVYFLLSMKLPIRVGNGYVHWNVGVGPAASFPRTISGLALKAISLGTEPKPHDHVITVELEEPTPTEETEARSGMMWICYQLAAAVAKELGLLDQEEYISQEEADDELRYYTYGMQDPIYRSLRNTIAPRVREMLLNKRYLLVVENLYEPIHRRSIFSRTVGLPLPDRWTRSEWVISTTSLDVMNRSKSEEDDIYGSFTNNETSAIILSALHQSSKCIFNTIRQGDERYWHRVALRCFHYAMLLFPQCSPPHGDGDPQSSIAPSVTSDELIHQWLAQGILINKPKLQETGSCCSKYHNVHQVGRVILEAFQEYSLLQLPFSPAREADEATKSATHFLLYHSLIAEGLTVNELSDDKELEHKQWISFVGDQGWHVSREWLRQEETSGPTALILRGCSQHFKLESSLPKLYFLRVLDLSYTPVNSLPSSIGCLLNLRLLSLRGCHDLKTLFSSSTAITTDSTTSSGSYSPLSTLCQLQILDMNGVPFSHLTQDIGNHKSNLIHLDMSYSKVTTFPLNFFQGMSNLEVLILLECPNLVELPPSMVALLSLTTLEIRGTQIKSFPHEIFAGMQHLQTLKLIDNKLLMSLPRSISEAQGLKELYIQGCDELREAEVLGGASLKTVFLSGGMQWLGLPKSLMEEAWHGCLEELRIEGWESTVVQEIKLDGHPTLKSFSLISAPHVRCLSLRKCTKLESVDLRDLGALEDLDLSATAIRELPADIPNLPQLKRLLLMGVPSLRRFPWHKLQRLPNVFCLDHYADGTNNHSNQVAQVCVGDSRLFYSFNNIARNLVRDGRFFQSFYVQVVACTVKIRKMQDGDDMVANKLQELLHKQSTYLDVYSSYKAEAVAIASPMIASLRQSQTEHHVEISTMNRRPYGLEYLLQVTKSIYVTSDTSISHLFDLSSFGELEECELRWCYQMEVVFQKTDGLKNLRNMHASNLKSLAHFYQPKRYIKEDSFSTLKHLHLEDCPRLEDMMPCETELPCLETLDILFCYNLKTIFYNYPGHQGYSSYQLPRLQRIHFQELPQLKHLRDDDTVITAPMWKELHVRGCWSLCRLPRLLQVKEEPSKVEVSGERAWWAKLRWDTPQHHGSYEPKLPQAFASFDECAEVTSYLR